MNPAATDSSLPPNADRRSVCVFVDGPLPIETVPVAPQTQGGAVLSFDGVVRRMENERALEALNYTVYQPMSQQLMDALAAETVERHGLIHLHVWHSIGPVQPGDVSFRVQILSAHRREAIAALAEFVDTMKREIPIWKTAIYSDEAS